jgi:hypothetical protein
MGAGAYIGFCCNGDTHIDLDTICDLDYNQDNIRGYRHSNDNEIAIRLGNIVSNAYTVHNCINHTQQLRYGHTNHIRHQYLHSNFHTVKNCDNHS